MLLGGDVLEEGQAEAVAETRDEEDVADGPESEALLEGGIFLL